MVPSTLLSRWYSRARTRGIERVPRGRVMLVANHAGQLPFDGAMLGVAMLLEAAPPRPMGALGGPWTAEPGGRGAGGAPARHARRPVDADLPVARAAGARAAARALPHPLRGAPAL